jgi:hypothetical protein
MMARRDNGDVARHASASETSLPRWLSNEPPRVFNDGAPGDIEGRFFLSIGFLLTP